jgi:hypothetical protein
MIHDLYLRRRGRIAVAAPQGSELLPLADVTTLSINLETLGFALSPEAVEACRRLSRAQLATLHKELVQAFSKELKADKKFRPMYPGFPREVMKMSEAQLYFNALVHYWSEGKSMPPSPRGFRRPRRENPTVRLIGLGTHAEFEGLFSQIVEANTAFSPRDRDDIAAFIAFYGLDIARLIPEKIPQRENVAHLAAALLSLPEVGDPFIRKHVRSATDVLRLACALSGGDASLATPTRFCSLSRPVRRRMLEILEAHPSTAEEILRRPEAWKRLGERLHPGEFVARFPQTAKAFDILRKDLPAETFGSQVEDALRRQAVPDAISLLAPRPGELVRRLDHLLRLDESAAEATLTTLEREIGKVSTPVLLQARHHFAHRAEPKSIRVFFPKGEVAKAHAEPDRLPPLREDLRQRTTEAMESTLIARFARLPSLGQVYIDPGLREFPMPFATRSASRALRTLPRGSRLDLPDVSTLRMFVWWTNGKERTDIDLSAVFFGEDFIFLDQVSYYNLKTYGGHHSGDIVDAPNGASEFIDVDLAPLRERNVRYVAVVLNSYTTQSYVELPECFAGWMARSAPNSGEIYEPRTVQDRLDLTADTTIAMPVLFDLVDRKVIWCDMALRRYPNFPNNVATNQSGITLTLRSMTEMSRPNLYDLFRLHAQARGTLVDAPEGADTVFSREAGTPFQLETIASDFMANAE